MSDLDIDAIADRLRAGESIDVSVLADLGGGAERSLLKRCAAVRIFDDELVEVLRTALPGEPAPAAHLRDLISVGKVEPVPGRDGCWRLPTAVRRKHFRRWWTENGRSAAVPDDLKALSAAVLERLERQPGEEVEALYHELIVKPEQAVGRFETLYADADARVDLARCQELLDVLGERLGMLGPELAALRNEYRRRLRIRALWLDDWYRSARFLVPADSRAAIEALLEGRHGRVLALWGGGGMGKTSHLRWLIARRCARAGDACARLDFDRLEPLVATREPWLLLLEAAAQLDRQLPDAPFHELLAQYPGQRERLRRRPSATPASDAGTVERDVFDRVAAGLRELPPDRRVVIVLDTLEEALLLGGSTREESPLRPLLEQLSELERHVPALRLVLAGRYDPHERIPGFAQLFPRAATLRIAPFSRAEARRYLKRLRRIERDDVVERIVASSDGIPLKLELIADVAEADPNIGAAEIERAFEQADLRYVMDRIVARLDGDLQQLLRYSVVPRVLDREFAGAVLAEWLPVEDEAALERLWKRLRRYAGSASWVTLDPHETDVVSFHPAVLEPMRALLRADPRHDRIHQRAAELFEQRAVRPGSERTRWLQEAIYHHFQRAGANAERYWRGLLAKARIDRDTVRRRALAAEVLRPDYVDDDGPREWRGGRPLIRPGTLLQARWELAVSSVRLTLEGDETEPRQAEWLEARRALADLEHLLLPADGRDAAVSEAQLALVRAGIALGRGDLGAAKDHMKRALRGRLHPEDRLWLRLAYARRASKRGLADALAQFKDALGLTEPGPDRSDVYLELAAHHAEHDRLDLAVRACERAAATAGERQQVEVRLRRAQLAVRHGAPSEALKELARIKHDDPDIGARVAIMRVRALLAAARPAEAVAVAEAARSRLGDALERGDSSLRRLAAEGRELRGKARAALLDEEAATRDLDWAAARWSRLGAGGAVCRCSVRAAALQLRGIGNLREASARLDQARRTDAERGGDAWTRCTLLGSELLARKGDAERGRELVDHVILELRRKARPPRALIEAALYGLAIADEQTVDRHLTLLCDQLERVAPATARLAALEGLDRCPRLPAASPELLLRLRRLVPSPLSAPGAYARLAPWDRALLLLRDADLDRIVGREHAAHRTLREAQKALGRDGARNLLGPAIRCGARPIVTAVARRELAARRGKPTLLDGAVAIEAAAQLLGTREGARLLERATEILVLHGATGGRWLARLEEVQGAEHGRRDELERMRKHLAHAAELYDALEDDLARDRVLQPIAPGRARRVAAVAEHELRVTARLRDDGLAFETQMSGRPPGEPRTAAASELVRELLEAPAGAAGRAAAPATVARILADPSAVGCELAELLLDAVRDVERRGAGPIDIGLRSKDTAVRALPWELARPELEPAGLRLWRRAPRTRGEPGDVRGLQGALNRLAGAGLAEDGIMGELTRRALERMQADLGVDPTGAPDEITEQRLHARLTGGRRPRVLIVRPTRRAEDLTFRGSRQSGVPVEWAYERAGFSPAVLDAPTPDDLRDALHRRPSAIVHLTAGLVNHHGTAAIDLLAARRSQGRSLPPGRLTGTALDRLIPRNLPTPLLVLDVPAPRSRRESVTQLLLRNAFAAELLAVGTVRAALATGLAHYVEQGKLYAALVMGLAGGDEIGAITRRLQDAAGPGFEQTLAFAATALFARTPYVRFPGTSAA